MELIKHVLEGADVSVCGLTCHMLSGHMPSPGFEPGLHL